MIHYQLRCGADHGFDGWFKDSAAFELQAGRGLVSCPECGSTQVNRALMAPSIGKKRVIVDQSGQTAEPPPPVATEQKLAAALPDQVRAVLQRLRAEIERTSDYVGPQFAEEARRIHRGDSEQRSIYGESSPAEAEALADEGIEIACIPWLPRADG